MKNSILFGLIAIIITSCGGKDEQKAKKSGQEIFFEQTTYDFGEIDEYSDTIFIIKFKNIGDKAIIINRVRSTCGCTIPSWPREPINSGKSGEIEVKYNTALTGTFMKAVYVYSSADNSPVKLTVKGKVIPKPKDDNENLNRIEIPE
jgi:hypothetical protein